MNNDIIKQCAFYSIIPNFYSTNVIPSSRNKVFVIKQDQIISFNNSCIYDNCRQDVGLTCINEVCLCGDDKRQVFLPFFFFPI